jgi:TonB family protein
MKKNNIFLSMLGLSAALHGFVMIGITGNVFCTTFPASEDQFVSTIKMIPVGIPQQKTTQAQIPEEKAIKKSVEPPPELPVSDTAHSEEVVKDDETQEIDNGNYEEVSEEEAKEGGANTSSEYEGLAYNNEDIQEGEPGTITDREHEALLAYIKEFIDKNLVYPPMAQRRNIHGVVGVYFEIETNGVLASVTVDRSSGSSILDNAAVSLIKKMYPPENVTLNRALALSVNIEYKLTE